MTIADISNAEGGASVRGKLNAVIAKANASSPVSQALTPVSYSATVTLDLASGATQMFGPLTLTGDATLANPSNPEVGAVVVLRIQQDGTGERTLSYGSHWRFAGGAPDLSEAANVVDVLTGVVLASDFIAASLQKDFKA